MPQSYSPRPQALVCPKTRQQGLRNPASPFVFAAAGFLFLSPAVLPTAIAQSAGAQTAAPVTVNKSPQSGQAQSGPVVLQGAVADPDAAEIRAQP